MAEPSRNARARRQRRPSSSPTVDKDLRLQISYVAVTDIEPYEFNPRNNATAVEAVEESLRQFGFVIPAILDANNVIVAGHTRLEAALRLDYTHIPVIRAEHLTPEQVDAFRLIDNKTAELATWDFDLLAGEVAKLQDTGIVLTDFGWTQESLDCLAEVVADDCLSTEGLITEDDRERIQHNERRAPSRVRYVLGEISFHIEAVDYRRWVDALRVENDYNDSDIVAAIKQRLGILEESQVAAERVRRRRSSSAPH